MGSFNHISPSVTNAQHRNTINNVEFKKGLLGSTQSNNRISSEPGVVCILGNGKIITFPRPQPPPSPRPHPRPGPIRPGPPPGVPTPPPTPRRPVNGPPRQDQDVMSNKKHRAIIITFPNPQPPPSPRPQPRPGPVNPGPPPGVPTPPPTPRRANTLGVIF